MRPSELAAAVEEMGYHRYWLAEHHSLPNFAGTSPEVLIGHVAARTKKIRVGSGGVMLSHYSAFKVAENFRMLESLHPGRIDLGIGRAPGSDQITAAALSFPNHPREIRHFPRQVVDLLGYLRGDMEDGHIFSQIQAGPDHEPVTAPEVWLLGSRYESAYMAAQLGPALRLRPFLRHCGGRGTGNRRQLPRKLQAVPVPPRAEGERRRTRHLR